VTLQRCLKNAGNGSAASACRHSPLSTRQNGIVKPRNRDHGHAEATGEFAKSRLRRYRFWTPFSTRKDWLSSVRSGSPSGSPPADEQTIVLCQALGARMRAARRRPDLRPSPDAYY